MPWQGTGEVSRAQELGEGEAGSMVHEQGKAKAANHM
jgi:hypothetical protein